MRLLAIGDIHGCFRALKTLVDFVGLREGDVLITLGDYVDRGPDSRLVLDWLDEQPDCMLYWEKFDDPPAHQSGKVMVCGHTSQKSGMPLSVGHAVCIDTWACGDGWLTCLNPRSGDHWQANQAGQTRQSSLQLER